MIYETLSEAMNDLRQRGYDYDFFMRDGEVKCPDLGIQCSPEQCTVLEYHRFEGMSDPGDNTILFGVETGGFKGLLVSGYGVYADPSIRKLIEKARQIRFNKDSAHQDIASFMPVVQALIPGIRKFFKEKVRQETLLGNIPPAAVDQQELLSDLYLRIFERLDQRPDDPAKLPEWLKEEAQALLEEKIKALKEKTGNISYEDLLGKWVNEMEENIAVDAEGELVLEEDLDDYPGGRPGIDIAA
jgi:hypothetical protein